MITAAVGLIAAAQGWTVGEHILEISAQQGMRPKKEEVLVAVANDKGPTAILTCNRRGQHGAFLFLGSSDPTNAIDRRLVQLNVLSGELKVKGRYANSGRFPGYGYDLYRVPSKKAAAEIFNGVITSAPVTFNQDTSKSRKLNLPEMDDNFRKFGRACAARRRATQG